MGRQGETGGNLDRPKNLGQICVAIDTPNNRLRPEKGVFQQEIKFDGFAGIPEQELEQVELEVLYPT